MIGSAYQAPSTDPS